MALGNLSQFLYGYTIAVDNQYIDFKASSGGPTLTAIIQNGYYSLTDLLVQIASAMNAADTANTYTATATRMYASGTVVNRVTIATSGTFLSLLFSSGSSAAASVATTIGFNELDFTGQTSYTGTMTTGSSVNPVQLGYNWVAPTRSKKIFGNVNISAIGQKEAIVFQIQQFFSVEFKYEPTVAVDNIWQPFLDWAIQQQDLEFTPDITQPNTFYNCTLEETESDGQGLGYDMMEMLPEFPNLYQTGKLKFRLNIVAPTLIL